MSEAYQYTVEKGDLVRMPNGLHGIVTSWDIICGGNCKIVRVRPLTSWPRRLWITLTAGDVFADDEINRLEPLQCAERKGDT